MNISINNLLTISTPTAGSNATHSQSKGPAAAGKFSLLLSSETNVKTKTDKKPPVNTTNPTDDTTEPQTNITQPTRRRRDDTSEQNPKIKPPQTQQEDSNTQPSTTGLTLAYLTSADNAAQPAETPLIPKQENLIRLQRTATDNESAEGGLAQNAVQIPVETNLIPQEEQLTNDTAAPVQQTLAGKTGPPSIKLPVEIIGPDNPQSIQNNDKKTTIGTEQAGQGTETEKIKPPQQIPNTEDQKTQKTAIIPDLPMTTEPLKTAQIGNESAEGGAEKEAGKTSQSKTKLQSADGEQNQSATGGNALISSNTIPNKTATLLPDDHKKPQIQITAEKGSGGNESAFGTLSNNQPAQNDQKIPSSQNISNDFPAFGGPSDLSGQIQESASALLTSNKNQVTIRLNPPELGSVCLKVSDNGHQITGLLQITKPETKYEIQQLLPGIIRNLEDAGISVKSFDVVLNNQPDQQMAQQSLYQQNNQNSYIPNRENTADYQTFNYSLNNENGLQAISSSQRIAASAGSLNILM
jgi:hypothetical protein